LDEVFSKEYSRDKEVLDLINECLFELISSQSEVDRNKLQCFEYKIKNLVDKQAFAKDLTTQKQYFLRSEWTTVKNIVGNEVFKHLYKRYLFFQKTSEGSLVQFCGTNIFNFLETNAGKRFNRGQNEEEVKKTSK
jgi:hypothetical protein